MERHLQKLNWPTLTDLVPEKIDTIILPIGTVEAHGTACVGTDNVIPETLADGIADRIDALIAPTVNYGITKSLFRYSGGVTIEPDVFEAYVRDIVDSFVKNGFTNVIVLNGHGGNNSSLKKVAYEFHVETGRNMAVTHWWELCDKLDREFWGHPGGHGGTNEAALVQAVDPANLDESDYDPDMAYHFRPGADVYPVPGTILLYEEGVGYPQFDLDKAREYRDLVIKEVGDFVQMILERWARMGV